MKTTLRISVLMTVLAFCGATAALAQQTAPSAQNTNQGASQKTQPLGGKLLVDFNLAAQSQSTEASTDFSFPLYGQTASVTTTSANDGGPMFDASVGYQIKPRIGVAVGFTHFSQTGTAQGAASIPSPIFFNRPANVTIPATDVKRSDRDVYLVVLGFVPITPVIKLTGFIGPSFGHVEQELITGVTVPDGTQSISSTTITTQNGSSTGVNVGVDLSYMFTPLVGAGVFMRYNGGSVDLDTANDVKWGGFQLGIGARLRF